MRERVCEREPVLVSVRERERGRGSGRERRRDSRKEISRERSRGRARVNQRVRVNSSPSHRWRDYGRRRDVFEVNTTCIDVEQQREIQTNQLQGTWTQVKGRRKARSKPHSAQGKDTVGHHAIYQNTSRGRRSTPSWRDRPDITSFYFSHFPDHVHEKDLWKIFQEWGKVWEVFIPTKRNKQGHRYGFVRFKAVEDDERLERRLDNNLYIKGMKLFAFLEMCSGK